MFANCPNLTNFVMENNYKETAEEVQDGNNERVKHIEYRELYLKDWMPALINMDYLFYHHTF